MKEVILRDNVPQNDIMKRYSLGTFLTYHDNQEVTFNLCAQSKFGIQCQNKFGMTSVFNMVLNVIVQQKVPAKIINLILRKCKNEVNCKEMVYSLNCYLFSFSTYKRIFC